jgi:hypothetical protein
MIVLDHPQSGRTAHSPSGQAQVPCRSGAFERGPKPDEWAERKRKRKSIRFDNAGNAEDLGPRLKNI